MRGLIWVPTLNTYRVSVKNSLAYKTYRDEEKSYAGFYAGLAFK